MDQDGDVEEEEEEEEERVQELEHEEPVTKKHRQMPYKRFLPSGVSL